MFVAWWRHRYGKEVSNAWAVAFGIAVISGALIADPATVAAVAIVRHIVMWVFMNKLGGHVVKVLDTTPAVDRTDELRPPEEVVRREDARATARPDPDHDQGASETARSPPEKPKQAATGEFSAI